MIDIATGTGAVLRAIGSARDDLDLLGVDYARLPEPAPAKMRLLGEIRVEHLPFDDGAFDGITSQFGFEYAERRAAAGEIVRVARPGAPVQLVVHHVDSPILLQNRKRRRAIEACRENRLTELARRALMPAGDTGALDRAAAELEKAFPDQIAVREIPAALREAVAARSAERIDAIEQGMARETAILDELLRVALDRPGIEALVASLSDGFACEAPSALVPEAADRPIAWLVSGRRKR
ncbi:MAG: class I SAM-dependent methyltransferase [Sphingomonadales bacterium]|nr:class I SAM-dependent methyltransferase [Sphingomonadales bacterium]